VSQATMKHSWDELIEEIGKCTVLCANCHAVWHHLEHLARVPKSGQFNVGHWTAEEKTKFLEGLLVFGKGKWKKIAEDFVVTRTHTHTGCKPRFDTLQRVGKVRKTDLGLKL
jgi:hypothetical protein